MTEVNGLRLAYRGFVAGLAGAYAWVAVTMLLGALIDADPLAMLRPIAVAITPLAGSAELAFVLGLAAVQAAGGFIGLCFAYFFARFFTVRPTLQVAAPVVAVLAWAVLGGLVAPEGTVPGIATHVAPLLATLAYGLFLAAAVPVRGEVLRQSGSPST